MHGTVPIDGRGSRGVPSKVALIATIPLSLLPSLGSAQIISTSVPRVVTQVTAGDQDKTFAIHLMASPFSKWHYNEIVGGNIGDSEFSTLASSRVLPTPIFCSPARASSNSGAKSASVSAGGTTRSETSFTISASTHSTATLTSSTTRRAGSRAISNSQKGM